MRDGNDVVRAPPVDVAAEALVAQVFRDFERYVEVERRVHPKEWDVSEHGADAIAAKRDQLLLKWVTSNPRVTAAEYRAAMDEFDRRKVAAADAARATAAREAIMEAGGLWEGARPGGRTQV